MGYNSLLGVVVQRPTQVLGNPAGADPSPRDIFTIAGGAVLVTQIVGWVTTLMDATVSTLQLTHSVGNVALSAAIAAIADDAVGTAYTISGDFADLMYKAEAAVNGAIRGGLRGGLAAGGAGQIIANGILMIPGNIHMVWTGDQDGAIQWTLCYVPITAGATVVPA